MGGGVARVSMGRATRAETWTPERPVGLETLSTTLDRRDA